MTLIRMSIRTTTGPKNRKVNMPKSAAAISPISSGFVRGGANANPSWADKFTGIRKPLFDPDAWMVGEAVKEPEAPKPNISLTLLDEEKAPAMSRDQAKASGYTGDTCDACGSTRMKVSGHCNVCEECGTSTGCS